MSLPPKSPSQQRVEDIQKVVDEIDEVRKLPPGEDRTRRQRDLSARINALNTTSDSEEKKAVRFDLQLIEGHNELLVDCTITHSLAKSHVTAEAKRTWQRLPSTVKEVRNQPAAAIDKARRKKSQTYLPLLYVIKKQVLDRRRQNTPVFTPAAVTSFGSSGRGALSFRSGWQYASKRIMSLLVIGRMG